jgi:polyphosphate kinase 2 (PPK2 family)
VLFDRSWQNRVAVERVARLSLIRDMLTRLEYGGRDDEKIQLDPVVVVTYDRIASGETSLFS